MLALYHGANSVCSIKVRIALAEKDLDWESRHVDLPKGEQFTPEYLKINPAGVVPVLNHDSALINESSVIAEYVDTLSPDNPLLPDGAVAQAKSRIWGIRTLGYHDAVNTLTFASYQRTMLLTKTPEELEERYAKIPDPTKAKKLRDLVENGPASDYVPVAFDRLLRMCVNIEMDLADRPWLIGENYSLAEALVTAYIYRVECIGLSRLWEARFPLMTDWYARVKARPSMHVATAPWLDRAAIENMTAAGQEAFIAGRQFDRYLS